MNKTLMIALVTVVLLIALFSAIAFVFMSPYPRLIEEPAAEYNVRMQNSSAVSQGSILSISFNYTNQGTKSLTIQRFYILGTNNKYGVGVGGVVPQQQIPGLAVYFNGTTMKNAESFNFVLRPHDSVLANITIPTYTQYVTGTYVAVNVVQKEIISGFLGIQIN